MYCRKCGTQNDDSQINCVSCGEALRRIPGPDEARKISTCLILSIAATALCCMPLGIPAIIYSAMANGKIQSGDVNGAMKSLRKAKIWLWTAFGAGLSVYILYAGCLIFSSPAGK